MNKRKKASYGMKKKMRGGDYMEPNKELKFGGPSSRVKAKKGRRKAGDGDPVEEKSYLERASDTWNTMKENMRNYGKNSTYGQSDEAKARKAKVKGSGNKKTSNDSKYREVDSKGNQIYGTPKERKEIKAVKAKQSNPYAAAKKRDSNLDSYIKQRNAAEKGSLEYNEAQNKINKAYGKGPTNRPTAKPAEKPKAAPAPMKTTVKPVDRSIKMGKDRVPVKPENLSKGMAEQGLKQAGERLQKSKTSQASPTTKKESRIMSRADKKVGKIQDRRAKAATRESARGRKDTAKQAAKDSGATRGQARAAGKMAKAGVKGKEKKFDRQYEKFGNKAKAEKPAKPSRSERRAPIKEARAEKRAEIRTAKGKQPRKKAFLGAAKTIAGAVGKLAPEGSKLGNIANTVSGVLDNPLQAGINAIKGQPIAGGGQQQPAAGGAPPAANPMMPQPGATGQPAQQQTMKKGGKKRKMMGGKKMKYKTGGAKPDYLDMDKDGNKTESMKSALKDRRSKARYGKKK